MEKHLKKIKAHGLVEVIGDGRISCSCNMNVDGDFMTGDFCCSDCVPAIQDWDGNLIPMPKKGRVKK
jgi:hypothetical protein